MPIATSLNFLIGRFGSSRSRSTVAKYRGSNSDADLEAISDSDGGVVGLVGVELGGELTGGLALGGRLGLGEEPGPPEHDIATTNSRTVVAIVGIRRG
ncbi:hypothetical protein GCM10027020_12820 [Nocardioides salsibiostraticola]